MNMYLAGSSDLGGMGAAKRVLDGLRCLISKYGISKIEVCGGFFKLYSSSFASALDLLSIHRTPQNAFTSPAPLPTLVPSQCSSIIQ